MTLSNGTLSYSWWRNTLQDESFYSPRWRPLTWLSSSLRTSSLSASFSALNSSLVMTYSAQCY